MALEFPHLVPTDRPEALKSFVEGSEQFRAYLGTGSSDELEKASQLFKEAVNNDPNFDLAIFYHALTRAELRDSDTAIEELRGLIDKGVDFLPKAYLHLAYAHTKRYLDEGYYQAEKALDRATAEAKKNGEKDLKPIIEAYRVFLYSVMGGRLKEADNETKNRYIDEAIRLGKRNLRNRPWRRNPHSMYLVKLELHNAIGIAYMRKGEASEAFSKQQEKYWGLARKHFQAALELEMSPVRIRQNIGTLMNIQGRQLQKRNAPGDAEKAEDCYRKAVQEYRLSISINPLDQFPHYALARLYARLNQWDLAREQLTYGRQQRGAVEPAAWEQVEKAISQKDASILEELTKKANWN
jgi:tetratricopeptide (TPR) repeat protein